MATTALSLILVLTGHAQRPAASARVPVAAASKAPEPVDINRASVAKLMKVPGMTRVWAERIVRFRPYRSKQDLLEDGIVPGSVYRKIKDSIIAHRPKQ